MTTPCKHPETVTDSRVERDDEGWPIGLGLHVKCKLCGQYLPFRGDRFLRHGLRGEFAALELQREKP